ncbi:hypothetical protein ACIQXI_07765 [Lysinibacillus sp. NPDC097195]|uniref:hypothetical protein n=1 Tax=Lysinibacillus sp. NPDC097195 TaxID=3364141 RepID=UPI003823492A
MEYSEIIVFLIVYSGLITFFLLPFRSGMNVIKQRKGQIKFTQIFKENFIGIIFHKKAILAVILLIFTLFYVWSAYADTEYHFNAHNGYPSISLELNALYSMIGVFLYTVVLALCIAFLKTLKIVKAVR